MIQHQPLHNSVVLEECVLDILSTLVRTANSSRDKHRDGGGFTRGDYQSSAWISHQPCGDTKVRVYGNSDYSDGSLSKEIFPDPACICYVDIAKVLAVGYLTYRVFSKVVSNITSALVEFADQEFYSNIFIPIRKLANTTILILPLG